VGVGRGDEVWLRWCRDEAERRARSSGALQSWLDPSDSSQEESRGSRARRAGLLGAYLTTTGWKQRMLVSIRKFDSVV